MMEIYSRKSQMQWEAYTDRVGLGFNERDRLFVKALRLSYDSSNVAVWRNITLPEKLNYKFRLHTGQMEIVDYDVDQKTGVSRRANPPI